MRINIVTLVAVCRRDEWREVEVDHHLTLPEGMNGLEVEAAAERAAVDVAKREGGTMVWSQWTFHHGDPKCECECHKARSNTLHAFPCCQEGS